MITQIIASKRCNSDYTDNLCNLIWHILQAKNLCNRYKKLLRIFSNSIKFFIFSLIFPCVDMIIESDNAQKFFYVSLGKKT